jgi:hypothetical protein
MEKKMATIELAISIRQPYVEQILLGVKKYEYRSALTHIRGRVYLYAAKKPVDSAAEWRKATGANPENCLRALSSAALWSLDVSHGKMTASTSQSFSVAVELAVSSGFIQAR